jgi:hypothetical protein
MATMSPHLSGMLESSQGRLALRQPQRTSAFIFRRDVAELVVAILVEDGPTKFKERNVR